MGWWTNAGWIQYFHSLARSHTHTHTHTQSLLGKSFASCVFIHVVLLFIGFTFISVSNRCPWCCDVTSLWHSFPGWADTHTLTHTYIHLFKWDDWWWCKVLTKEREQSTHLCISEMSSFSSSLQVTVNVWIPPVWHHNCQISVFRFKPSHLSYAAYQQ